MDRESAKMDSMLKLYVRDGQGKRLSVGGFIAFCEKVSPDIVDYVKGNSYFCSYELERLQNG